MSKFEDFYSKLMTDTALRSKLAEIIGDRSITEVDDETLEKIGALAKEAGFAITLAEAKEYLSANETVVSDEALDAVAGGRGPQKDVVLRDDSFPKDPRDGLKNTEPEIRR